MFGRGGLKPHTFPLRYSTLNGEMSALALTEGSVCASKRVIPLIREMSSLRDKRMTLAVDEVCCLNSTFKIIRRKQSKHIVTSSVGSKYSPTPSRHNILRDWNILLGKYVCNMLLITPNVLPFRFGTSIQIGLYKSKSSLRRNFDLRGETYKAINSDLLTNRFNRGICLDEGRHDRFDWLSSAHFRAPKFVIRHS